MELILQVPLLTRRLGTNLEDKRYRVELKLPSVALGSLTEVTFGRPSELGISVKYEY